MTTQEILNIQTALDKAVKGGYLQGKYTLILYPSGFIHIVPDADETLGIPDKSIADVVMDREFWKALGKSLGWGVCDIDHSTIENPNLCYCAGGIWFVEWHNFIDHLAEGKDISTYFSNL